MLKLFPMIIKTTRDFVFILIGVASASLGLTGFLIPNRFLDGGITGISLLIHFTTNWNFPLLVVLINIPFLIMGSRLISKTFALKTAIAIGLLSCAVFFIDYPTITTDKILIAVFGGTFLGAGIGFAIRGGAVIDGTEVLALFISRKTRWMVGSVILLFNVIIFICAAILLNIETAMYAMLTYFVASKAVDFIVHGIEEYTGVTVISEHNKNIRTMIINTLGRGITLYEGKRGLHEEPIDIIYTVVTRLEIPRLITEIQNIDPNAFITQQSLSDAIGGVVKHRSLS
ncbi:MAG: YitT family protein [Candidatus Margulisiibacteriota bacterium]